MSSRRLK